VLQVLIKDGVEACTLGRVAEISGLQRSTLYRRFDDRWDMIIQAYTASAANEVAEQPTGDFLLDFRILLGRFIENFSQPIGQAIMSVVLAVRGTPAEQYIDRFMEMRLAQLQPMFSAGIAAGTLNPRADAREIVERAAGAVIFRLFVEGLPVDQDWIDGMIDAIDRLYCRQEVETPS
jgi:AcrR family transcriptional regulator